MIVKKVSLGKFSIGLEKLVGFGKSCEGIGPVEIVGLGLHSRHSHHLRNGIVYHFISLPLEKLDFFNGGGLGIRDSHEHVDNIGAHVLALSREKSTPTHLAAVGLSLMKLLKNSS